MTSNFRDDTAAQRMLVQDAARLEDVRLKHQRIRCLLESSNADAVLLQDPANIAWFTAGTDLFRCAAEGCSTSVFVTREARLFATNSVDSAQIFEREAFGLGFQLKQREWFQPHEELITDLCRGRRVISDRHAEGTIATPRAIDEIRLPLTQLEVERMRLLSQVAVHAVEATAHHVRPGVTESEVAGEVSHRLLKRTVAVAKIQVCADGRNERYRHWTFGEQPIADYAVISCVARRWGLHVGVTRTVCVKSVPEDLWAAYQKAALVHSTGMFFSRDKATLGGVWKKVHRIYEKFDIGNEWQLADQANVTGYRQSEIQLVPNSDYLIQAPTPVFWHPSVGPALVGDTVLCRESSNEILTASTSWPQIPVKIKGRDVACPGILLLKSQEERDQQIDCPDHPGEEMPSPLDSVWEMKVPRDALAWGSDDSGWSKT